MYECRIRMQVIGEDGVHTKRLTFTPETVVLYFESRMWLGLGQRRTLVKVRKRLLCCECHNITKLTDIVILQVGIVGQQLSQ